MNTSNHNDDREGPATYTRASLVLLAVGSAAILYLINGVESQRYGLSARLTIVLLSVVATYAGATAIVVEMRRRTLRDEFLDALLDLQIRSKWLGNQSATLNERDTELGFSVDLHGSLLQKWSLVALVEANLLTESEVSTMMFWSTRILDGKKLSPPFQQRVTTFAKELVLRVTLPPPPDSTP